MDQKQFDNLIKHILETISSEEYLQHYKIYRSKPLSIRDWDKFVKK